MREELYSFLPPFSRLPLTSPLPRLRCSLSLSGRSSKFRLSVSLILILLSLVTSCAAFRPLLKQPPPADKTRVVNSTRRKPTHLSLSTTSPPLSRGKPGVFLKFLRPPLTSLHSTALGDAESQLFPIGKSSQGFLEIFSWNGPGNSFFKISPADSRRPGRFNLGSENRRRGERGGTTKPGEELRFASSLTWLVVMRRAKRCPRTSAWFPRCLVTRKRKIETTKRSSCGHDEVERRGMRAEVDETMGRRDAA